MRDHLKVEAQAW